MKKTSNKKLTTIDELTDQIVGKKGTEAREQFEYELEIDVLGTMIKNARLKQNLTQEQLGNRIGVGKAQISKLENNTKDFRIGTIIKAVKALNLKVKLTLEQDESLALS